MTWKDIFDNINHLDGDQYLRFYDENNCLLSQHDIDRLCTLDNEVAVEFDCNTLNEEGRWADYIFLDTDYNFVYFEVPSNCLIKSLCENDKDWLRDQYDCF